MPKIVDHRIQREEVLLATWRTIAAHGVSGVTIRRIAKEAGVSTGFITHYFKDKDEVLAGALKLSNERSAERVIDRLGKRKGLRGLRTFIEAVLPLDDERRLEWLIWLTFWRQPGADDALTGEKKRGRDLWREGVGRLLAEAAQMGELRAGLDLAYEADKLVVLVSGIGLQSQSRGGDSVRKRALAFVDDHLALLAAEPVG